MLFFCSLFLVDSFGKNSHINYVNSAPTTIENLFDLSSSSINGEFSNGM